MPVSRKQQEDMEKLATDRWNDDHKQINQRRSLRVLWIAIAIAAVSLIVLLLYLFMFGKKSKPSLPVQLPEASPLTTNKFLDDPTLALPSYVYNKR